jgi:hypothetical protein
LTLPSGAADANGRIGQLKGTGLVLERVNVPFATQPSRVVLQQQGGAVEQSVQFAYKAGVVEVSLALQCCAYLSASAEPLPEPSLPLYRFTTSSLSWSIRLL